MQELTCAPPRPLRAHEGQREARALLDDLVQSSLVLAEDLDNLPLASRNELADCTDRSRLIRLLVDQGMFTEYQAGRLESGTRFGLVLGNYRVLDRLGAGGMGVVFRAENIRMRRQVAIKVMPVSPEQDPRLLRRFMTEIRAIAQLHHPNIVGAIDAGELEGDGQSLHFFVMEYVPGQDLEDYVRSQGPLPATLACDLIHQIASALAEANKHGLVHRDIKPSNIQVTPEGQAKLLDFGLARKFSNGITEQGTLLGTLDYMAPEQIQDAHTVDIRADLYGLGGVLYWCLTGRAPFPSKGNFVHELSARIKQQPPSVRAKRPELPAELDEIVRKMMALRPDDRFPTPQAVMRALLPLLKDEQGEYAFDNVPMTTGENGSAAQGDLYASPRVSHVLLVDDEASIRTYSRYVLQGEGLVCDEADCGAAALKKIKEKNFDLLVLDINMPDMTGLDVCRILRENPPWPNMKIIMASGNSNTDAMAKLLLNGADDFITKPFSVQQLQSRVKSLLRLKDAQDRAEVLNRHLTTVNHQLEKSLSARDSDLAEARNALVLALAKLVEHRATETSAHLARLQLFVRTLAFEASRTPGLASQIDDGFIELVACCAPLHDIGKVGLPDHILLKPGKLDADERMSMQAHTIIGAETLAEVAKSHPSASAFLHMAIDITRHHHERYDGTGYPDRLAGSDIPLAARLVSICDVYDALRSRRVYKPALSHNATMQVMGESAGVQFDPVLMRVFQHSSGQFEQIFRDNPD